MGTIPCVRSFFGSWGRVNQRSPPEFWRLSLQEPCFIGHLFGTLEWIVYFSPQYLPPHLPDVHSRQSFFHFVFELREQLIKSRLTLLEFNQAAVVGLNLKLLCSFVKHDIHFPLDLFDLRIVFSMLKLCIFLIFHHHPICQLLLLSF
jgi:hypothetical protein